MSKAMPNLLLITGAAGFVGSHAVKFALKNSNYDVVLATDIRELDLRGIESIAPKDKVFGFIKADLTKPEQLEEIIKYLKNFSDHKIVVWHIGGCFNYQAPKELLYRVNVLGTKALLEKLWKFEQRSRLQRFVFWSGGVVYGTFSHPKGTLPADENYPVDPQNEYGWSKKMAEDWVLYFDRQLSLPATILRLGAIYGPNSVYGMASALFLNASGQLAPLLVGDPNNKVALIHVEDVVRVADFLAWAPEASGEIYNVTDDNDYTMKEISFFMGKKLNNTPFASFALPAWVFRTLIKFVNLRIKKLGGTPIIDPELGNMVLLNSWMSNEKLMALTRKYGREHNLLKYPDSLFGLTDTIESYKKEGKL